MLVILGGHGFIGTALCRRIDALDVGYIAPTIEAIDLLDSDKWPDIRNLIKDGDTLIFIAALTQEHGEACKLTEWNIRMAANMIYSVMGKNIAHCVYLSSDSVYGNPDDVITESTPLRPINLYGMMHMIREQMFRERFPNLTILRPCAVYGLGDTHNAYGINQFIRDAREKGVITLFGDGEEYRSNIHVNDLAKIIAISAIDKIPGTFNANCGEARSFKQLAGEIQKHTNCDIASKPRTQSVSHRYVYNQKLTDTFFEPRTTDIGIKQLLGDAGDV